jgi:RNA-directed DNA polymerase
MSGRFNNVKQGDLSGIQAGEGWSFRSQSVRSSEEVGQRRWSQGAQEDGCEMTRPTESKPAIVPWAQQAGASHALWRCAKPCVWTVRMLTTLISGVKGDKWFRLIDKVFSERNLLAAFQQVARNGKAAGVDHVTAVEFERHLPETIRELSESLRSGSYRPQAIRRVHIPKPGSNETRPLGIPTIRDRVVQAAIVNVIEPIFEKDFANQSYGFRPNRGCKNALRRVDQLLRTGYVHVVDADLKGYFDTIPHDTLMERLAEKIADGPLLRLIAMFLTAPIQEDCEQSAPKSGTPQGAVLSPLLSNVYLDPLDHLLAESGFEMIRYADDFVILCRTAKKAQQALALVQAWVTENGLTLHPTKTHVVDSRTESFDFLGYRFVGTEHHVSDKSLRKLKDTIRRKTRRTCGRSLQAAIADVNKTLRGWFEYFKHSHHWTFEPLDRFVRQRLRSILKRHHKVSGVAKGRDMYRWPNNFFAKAGLFSLKTAYAHGLSILNEVKPSTGEPCAGDPHARFGGRRGSNQ